MDYSKECTDCKATFNFSESDIQQKNDTVTKSNLITREPLGGFWSCSCYCVVTTDYLTYNRFVKYVVCPICDFELILKEIIKKEPISITRKSEEIFDETAIVGF